MILQQIALFVNVLLYTFDNRIKTLFKMVS